MIKNFVSKIKATKKIANEKNVHNWYNCVYHSVLIIIGISLFLSIQTLMLIGISGETPLNQLPIFAVLLPIVYSLTLSYFFLEKLILFHIKVFEKLNKQVFKLWQKMDMYWFKKYRKHSPITEGLAKVQGKVSKFNGSKSKKQKRMITIAVIAGLLLLQIGYRGPAIMEALNDESEPFVTPEEMEQHLTPEELEEYKQLYNNEFENERMKVNIGK